MLTMMLNGLLLMLNSFGQLTLLHSAGGLNHWDEFLPHFALIILLKLSTVKVTFCLTAYPNDSS